MKTRLHAKDKGANCMGVRVATVEQYRERTCRAEVVNMKDAPAAFKTIRDTSNITLVIYHHFVQLLFCSVAKRLSRLPAALQKL